MKKEKPQFNKKRPLSWSAISSFEYDPEQWWKKYCLHGDCKRGVSCTVFKDVSKCVLNETSKEMEFGKAFADSVSAGAPLVSVEVLEEVEQKITSKIDEIDLIGFMDTFQHVSKLREYKTGKKAWTQKRANEHGQLKMYALMVYLEGQVRPEFLEIWLDWIPTCEDAEGNIQFVQPIKVQSFRVELRLPDILKFAGYIKDVHKEMEIYAKNHR